MVQISKLRDGRNLAFEEYGESSGWPVFLFHGWPSSRISGSHSDELAKKLNLRIIAADRPGFGLSTFKPNRELLDWPDDVLELADHLKIKKFSLIGGSGGVPYVLACAYKIPQRIKSAVIYAGLGPLVVRQDNNLNLKERLLLKAASQVSKFSLPLLFFYKFSIDNFPSVFTNLSLLGKPSSDKRTGRIDQFDKIFKLSVKEAFRQGIRGPFQDQKIYSSDWGFDLKDISMKIYFYHGEKDKNVPCWIAKYLSSQLKNCETKFIPNVGHYLMRSYGKEMLSKL